MRSSCKIASDHKVRQILSAASPVGAFVRADMIMRKDLPRQPHDFGYVALDTCSYIA